MGRTAARPWTFMVYMAGDNDLEAFGRLDLAEMSQSAGLGRANVIAQLDGMSEGCAYRYVASEGNDSLRQARKVPSVNTGDPKALVGFVSWCAERYPADHYALVLWNHGRGWKDDDVYAAARAAARAAAAGPAPDTELRQAAAQARHVLFRTTVGRAGAAATDPEMRGILYDNSAMDFLDSVEMRGALMGIKARLGRGLDVLGFDACLMSMIEIHAQVGDLCDVVVGSEETEPTDGWPYDRVLAAFADDPAIDPSALGRHIVRVYAEQAPSRASLTQSAIRSAGLRATVDGLTTLARAALEELSKQPRGFGRSMARVLRATQSFKDPDYVDLLDLCRNIADEFGAASAIGQAASGVTQSLTGPGSPILASVAIGPGLERAGGISIYLPARAVSPLYRNLEFAQGSWDEFISALVR